MSKKGLLVISFGTSYPETRKKTIDAIETSMQNAFTDHSFYHAFSSSFIIRKLAKQGEHMESVTEAIEKAISDGITDLLVQPTHLMRAIEYDKIAGLLAEYKNSFTTIRLGAPLLSNETDLEEICSHFHEMYPSLSEEGSSLVLMGHGTEHRYNFIYRQLHDLLLRQNPNVFIGTVEAEPSLADVIEQLHAHDAAKNGEAEAQTKKVYLTPLLVVAGDHATNDMASDDDDSWKSQLAAAGYDVTCILKGLGEYECIRQMYVRHAKEAIYL